MTRFRQASKRDAVSVASVRASFVTGEEALRQKVPSLKVEYNEDLRIPEVIAPDIKQGRNFLTGGSDAGRSDILRGFIKENGSLLGVNEEQADQLELTADYTNPEAPLSFVHFEQKINGVPVFRGEIKAGFTNQGEVIRVINNLAPDLDYESISTDFRNPEDAVRAAFRNVTRQITAEDTRTNAAESTDLKAKFGSGDWATTAEKMYFPTEPGVAVPAWRVIIWEPVNAYMVIVDAETGTLLWRKNATEEQTQSATYNVYTNPNAMINVAESPAPLSPGPVNPNFATQGLAIPRTNVTRVGNEAPYTFNNNGWINNGNNTTDGNAVEAGVDRVSPDGIDATQAGTPNRVFSSTWQPPPLIFAQADDPLTPQAQRGAVIQMFYLMNLYHDELYRLGFHEQARNFQQNNFGRGGAGKDRISAEAQDPSELNNARFITMPDGNRGRMQMGLWNGPTPDRDGTADAEIIIHEATHGTSNRLIGNGEGLTTNMSRGLGEGWSDIFAHAMLSQASDPIQGIYAMGGYATNLVTTGFNANYYYGIRRFPKAVISFTGPNGKPHNPLTFRHLNSNCNTEIGTTQTIGTISAYPRGPIGGGDCDQVHNAGEIWSSALWEVRSRFVTRLGWEVGNRRFLQFVFLGMSVSPLNPTFLQARDSINLVAIFAGELADVADIWEGFRLRGMGLNASIQNTGTGANNTVVTENYDAPQLTVSIQPSNLSFTATVGGANPESKEFEIVQDIAFDVNWTATDTANWLTVSEHPTLFKKGVVSVNSSNLAPGTYNTTIRVNIPGASNSPVFVPVTLTVKPAPLSVNPTSLNFSGFASGTNPAGQQLSISNSSGSSISFSTTGAANWLSVSPTTGNVPPGGTVPAMVSVNTAGLDAGVYNGKIKIAAAGFTREVPVTLTVKTSQMSVNPASLSFSGFANGVKPANQELNITNSGNDPLTVSTTDDANWLTVATPAGSIPEGETRHATVSVNISGLGAGTRNATIKVTDTVAGVTREVPVTLTLNPPTSVINVNPTGFSLVASAGESIAVPLIITNSGSGTLKWTAIDDADWLGVSPTTGIGPSTLTVTVNTSGLRFGTLGTITISAAGAATKTVPVEITILNDPTQ